MLDKKTSSVRLILFAFFSHLAFTVILMMKPSERRNTFEELVKDAQ
jgi:hypothetical protein